MNWTEANQRYLMSALDAVRGAGGPVMRALLERLGCTVTGINLETDGQFPRAPEPVPENLGELSALVRRTGADLGIAVDPDVDRLAIVDENGTPIGEDYTLAFAVRAVLGGQSDGRTVGPEGRGQSDRPTVRPSVLVGVDAGGSKTAVAIADGDLRILARGDGPGAAMRPGGGSRSAACHLNDVVAKTA